MKTYARPLIAALAALVLAASTYALYVHYRLAYDLSYTSACEVSATVSCQQVFTSPYGSAFGIPVAAGGAIWAAFVLLLAVGALRTRDKDLASRLTGYIFAAATVGLAAVFYFAYASFVVLGVTCLVCFTMYVGITGIFVLSAATAGPLTRLPANLGKDLSLLGRSTLAQVLAAAWVIAAIGLIVLFPREQAVTAAAGTAGAVEAPALEPLTAEQRAQWERWLDAQPREEEALPQGDVKVLVMKFNDFQCPSCRRAWQLYQHIFDRYEAQYPGVFVFDKRDFPLETECGVPGQFFGSCEAAVAVRLAREKGLDREMGTWLYEHQTGGFTRERVKEALEEVAQVTNFDERYDELLEAVRADSQLGQRLGVAATPTLFLNGIRMDARGGIRPEFWDAAIAYELRRTGVTSGAEAGE